jgi:heat shock protein HspQ
VTRGSGWLYHQSQHGEEYMGIVTSISRSKFSVGDVIHHQLFDYRGVVVDVDATFQSTEEWYEAVGCIPHHICG